MVLYEFLMIIKAATPRAQVADILRRAGNRVFDHNGVLTDITSYGTRQLAYKFKTPGETHFEAQMVQLTFNAKPQIIKEMNHDMATDERVMRWMAVKGKALKPLKSYKARDPRNPLNFQAKSAAR